MSKRLLFNYPVQDTTTSPSTVHVIIYFGQSNCRGTGTAEPVPAAFPPVRYLLRLLAGTEFYTTFQDLWVTTTDHSHGAEITLGQSLFGDGYAIAIVKVAKGATAMNQWVPGEPNFDDMVEEIGFAQAQIAAAYPGAAVVWHLMVNQGEEEARNPSPVPATNWGTFFAEVVQGNGAGDGLETIVGQTLRPHICLTQSTIAGATFVGILRTSQAAAAVALNGFTVDQDGLPTQADGVHLTSGAQYTLGSPLLYNSLLLELPPP